MPKVPIWIIGAKVNEVTTTERVNMSEMGTIIVTNQNNYSNRNDRVVTYVPPQNQTSAPRQGGGNMARIEICCRR